MTIAVYTPFTGSDGAAWPAPWTIRGTTASIQSNRGRLAPSAAGYVHTTAHTTGITIADARLSGELRTSTVSLEQYPAINLRHNGSWTGGVPDLGFLLYFDIAGDAMAIQLAVGGAVVVASIGTSASVAWDNDTTYRFTFEVIEGTGLTACRAKVWKPDGFGIEPEGWMIEGTTSHASRPASGGAGLAIVNGASGTPFMEFEDVVLQNVSDSRLRLLPVGDSITAGPYNRADNLSTTWRKYVYEYFEATATPLQMVGQNWAPGASHTGTGVGGAYEGKGTWDHDHHSRNSWQTSHVLADVGDDAVNYRPDLAVIYIGLNDLFNTVAVSTIVTNIGSIVTALRAGKSTIKIVLCQIAPNTVGTSVTAFNSAIVTYAAEATTGTSPIGVADCNTGFNTSWLYDGYHFNSSGDAFLAGRIQTAIETLLTVAPNTIGGYWGTQQFARGLPLPVIYASTQGAGFAGGDPLYGTVHMQPPHGVVAGDTLLIVCNIRMHGAEAALATITSVPGDWNLIWHSSVAVGQPNPSQQYIYRKTATASETQYEVQRYGAYGAGFMNASVNAIRGAGTIDGFVNVVPPAPHYIPAFTTTKPNTLLFCAYTAKDPLDQFIPMPPGAPIWYAVGSPYVWNHWNNYQRNAIVEGTYGPTTTHGGASHAVDQYTVMAIAPLPAAPKPDLTITYLEPNAGLIGGGTTVTIHGTSFAAGATTVKIGTITIPAANVTVTDGVTATFVTPAGPGGVTSVQAVTATVGAYTTNDKSFTYNTGGFSPSQIDGLLYWLDASEPSSVSTSGSNVTQWRDFSTNRYVFNASPQPTYTGTIYGLNVMQFTADSFQCASKVLNVQPYTFAWVMSPTLSGTQQAIYSQQFNQPTVEITTAGTITLNGMWHEIDTGVACGGLHAWVVLLDGPRSKMWKDGVLVWTSDVVNHPGSGFADGVPRIANNTHDFYRFTGLLPEFAVYATTFSGSDLTNLFQSWLDKWGIGGTAPTVSGAPTLNTATAATPTSVALVWTAPSSNGGSSVIDYIVERSNNGTSGWTVVADGFGTTTSYTVTGLTSDVIQYFRVIAVNGIGNSAPSSVLSATPTATVPGAPILSSATAGDTQVALAWTAPANNGGATISNYLVETSANGTTGWSTVTTINALAYTHTGRTNGTIYYYRVSAINSVGTGAASNVLSATPASAPAAGGGTFYSDDFDRANAALTTPWVNVEGIHSVVSNKLAVGTASPTVSYYNQTFAADQWAEGDVIGLDGTSSIFPAVRINGSNFYYMYRIGSNATIWKRDGGTYTQVASGSAIPTAFKARLEMVGTTLRGYADGVQVVTGTDSAIATGRSGILSSNGGGATLDNWRGGDMPYVPIFYSDNFDRANGALGTPWVNVDMTPQISGNRAAVQTAASGTQSARYDRTFAADQWAECDMVFTASSSTNTFGPMVRCGTASGGAKYFAWFNAGTNTIGLWSEASQIGSSVAITSPAKVRVEAEGTTVRLLINGALATSGTDSTATAGQPGLLGNSTPGGIVAFADNFRCGNLPYTPAGPAVASSSTEVGLAIGTGGNPQPVPAGVIAGDLLLAFVGNDLSGTATNGSTGWTKINETAQGSTNVKLATFARIADGGTNDILSLTGTGTQDYCTSILRITGHGILVPGDIKIAVTTGASGNADPPNLDATVSAAYLWVVAAAVDLDVGHSITAVPSGYIQAHAPLKSEDSATSVALGVGSRVATAQTEDPAAFANSSQEWVAVTVAVAPFSASTVPDAPTLNSVTAGASTTLTLAWTAGFNGRSPITGYTVEKSDNGTSGWTAAGTPTASPHTVTGLTNGTIQYFRVKATNAIGTGAASNVMSGTPSVPTVPAAPTLVSAAPGGGSGGVMLNWTAGSTGGMAITSYLIEKSPNGTSSWTSAGTPTASPYAVTGLVNGTIQYFRVSATNAVGTGPVSNVMSATPSETDTTLSWSYDFTGADGSALSSTYFGTVSGGNIQNNKWQFTTPNSAFGNVTALLRQDHSPNSFELLFDVKFSTKANGGYFTPFFRSGGAYRDMEMDIGSGNIRICGGVDNDNVSFTAADTLRYRVRAAGTALSVKVWVVGNSEPTDYTVVAPTAGPLENGQFVFDTRTGGSGVGYTTTIDNLFMYTIP